MPTVFTRDLKVITPTGDVYASSGPEYAKLLEQSMIGAVSCHEGMTAEIEIMDETNARGIWAMQDVIVWEDRHPRFGWKSIQGYGHYHETYRFEDGAWRIATLTLTRLRLDETWPAGEGPKQD
jgi:hypothetical protein